MENYFSFVTPKKFGECWKLTPLLGNHSSKESYLTLFKSVFPHIYLAKETSLHSVLIMILWSYEKPKCILGNTVFWAFGYRSAELLEPPSWHFSQGSLGFVKRGSAFSHPHRPGEKIATLGRPSQCKFWMWVVKNSCLSSPRTCPAPGEVPIEEEIHHFLPKQCFWWSGPLTYWIGGSVFGIIPGPRRNSSQKRFFVFE